MNLSKCFLNHVNTSPQHTVARSSQMNGALYWEFLPDVLNNPVCQLWLVPLYSSRISTRQWCSLLALLLMLFLILQTISKFPAEEFSLSLADYTDLHQLRSWPSILSENSG